MGALLGALVATSLVVGGGAFGAGYLVGSGNSAQSADPGASDTAAQGGVLTANEWFQAGQVQMQSGVAGGSLATTLPFTGDTTRAEVAQAYREWRTGIDDTIDYFVTNLAPPPQLYADLYDDTLVMLDALAVFVVTIAECHETRPDPPPNRDDCYFDADNSPLEEHIGTWYAWGLS